MEGGARQALIIATARYADPKLQALRAPEADARGLAAVLENPQIGAFAVDVALDGHEGELTRRLARFFRDARREDVLLLHLSCHGIKDDRGELYFAAADTEIDLPDATAIPARWLDEQVMRSPSRRILLLLDCCFSGRFPFQSRHRAGEGVDVHDQLQGRGHAVITASSAMEYAYEGEDLSGTGQPSYFTQAIIDALTTGEADRDGDHWISVDELYDYVLERVRERTPSQTPTKKIELQGPLYVARSLYEAPVQPAELDSHLLSLMEHPLAEARLGAVDALTQLLGSSDKGVALAARHRLEKLTDDDSKRVAARASDALAHLVEDSRSTSGRRMIEPLPQVLTPDRFHELARLTHEGPVTAVAFSRDGSEIASSCTDGSVRIWDSQTRRELSRLNHDAAVAGVAFSPDGSQVITASANRAQIWDTAEMQPFARLSHKDHVFGVAFSPDGTQVPRACRDGTARLWDVATGHQIRAIEHYGWVASVAFSSDGERMLTASFDRTARIWDIETGRELARFTHDGDVKEIVLSGSGGVLATACTDKTARVWDVGSRRELARITHHGAVMGVALTHGAEFLATASADKTVRIWETATSREVARLLHDGEVNGVVFGRGDRQIATACGNVRKGARLVVAMRAGPVKGYAGVWGSE